MNGDPPDWIYLSKVSLSFPCVLGVHEWERREAQTLVYRSTDRAASGEGWVAWSAPPVQVALDGAARVSGRATSTP